MADINGFLKIKRKDAGNRPLNERICDHSEVEQTLNSEDRMLQASRCMDCGIPFCHWSCPVDNLIPEWNDLLYKGDWKGAYQQTCMPQIIFLSLPEGYVLQAANMPVC